MALVPIDATKVILQTLDAAVPTLTVLVTQLAVAVSPPSIIEGTLANAVNVEHNASIRGFDINLRITNRTGNLPGQEKVGIIIRKNEGGLLGAPTVANMNGLNTMTWKARIFHNIQLKPGASESLPMGFVSIKIPKRFHKMSLGDVWELIVVNNSSGSVDMCGTVVYKWYR